MHVLILTPELNPFSGSGLGELAGTLCRALRDTGTQVTVITPYYSEVEGDRFGLARRIRKVNVALGDGQTVDVGLLDGKFPSSDVHVVFIDEPSSFARPGLYGEDGVPYPDNHRRFGLLCRSVPAIASDLGITPDVVHAFDWHTGMALLLHRDAPEGSALGSARTVLSIFDASAGVFERDALAELGLPEHLFTPEGVEFHGRLSLMKAGVLGADVVCAPSPRYARELVDEEQGFGLHGLFRTLGDRLRGVLGGIDYGTWDPATDHRIARPYDAENLEGKAACKRALQQELELPARTQVPLSRERGFDLVLDSLPHLAESAPTLQLAFIGATEETARRIAASREATPLTLAHAGAGDAGLLHRVLAGADALLLPALREPGGQLQLKALRYGAIPVAHCTGGLCDSVVDYDPGSGTGTGILFHTPEPDSLAVALGRLVGLFGDADPWRDLTVNAMRQRFTMESMARRYLEIYEELASQQAPDYS